MYHLLERMDIAYQMSQSVPDIGNERMRWGFKEVGIVGADVPFIGYQELVLFDDIALVRNNEIIERGGADLHLAVMILMSKDERFERSQGSHPAAIIRPSLAASSFSEEDLVSNLIGMSIGYQRYFEGASLETLRDQVKRECGTLGREASLAVFRNNTYNNGENLAPRWNSWYPRKLWLWGCPEDESVDRVIQNCNRQFHTFPERYAKLIDFRPRTGAFRWLRETGLGFRDFTQEEVANDLYVIRIV